MKQAYRMNVDKLLTAHSLVQENVKQPSHTEK